MVWKNILKQWKNKGSEPSEELFEQGFRGGYKPPAGVFNWFWHMVTTAIDELQIFGNLMQTKLDTIDEGAEVNVQADWDESSSDSDAFIKNKPGNATAEKVGFLSAEDKQKLDSIDDEANKTVVDSSLSDSSENPVENRAVKAAIDSKANAEHIHTPGDIVYTSRAELKCVFAITNKIGIDENFAGWQVDDPKSLPVDILQRAKKDIAQFEIGVPYTTDGFSFNSKLDVEIVNMKNDEQPQWGEVTEDTPDFAFYCFDGYVRYIGERHSYDESEGFKVNDEGFINITFPTGHTHRLAGSDITGSLPISKGGTGSNTAEGARAALGLGSASLLSDTSLLVYKGDIPAGADWDTYNTTGIWRCIRNDKSADTHYPPAWGWGYLIVLAYTTVIQYYIEGGMYPQDPIYSRGIGQDTWSYVGQSVFSPKNHTHAEYLPISSYKGRTHIVIATYDTKNPNKNYADYVCTSDNASSVIRQALNAVEAGGKIILLDGHYNLQYEENGEGIVINKKVSIEGTTWRGASMNQPIEQEGSKANPIFTINADDASIRNLNLYGCSSPVSLIKQKKPGAWYENLFFTQPKTTSGYNCIEGEVGANCRYTRIQNCRLYRNFYPPSPNTEFISFDFRKCANFNGIICGNMSTGQGNIDVGFANMSHRQATAIYGHSVIDLYIEDTNTKETIDYKGDITTTDYSE